MSQKRHTEELGCPSSGDKRRRRFPTLRSVIVEVLRMRQIHSLEQILEPSIRKVVKEEVEHAFLRHFTSIKRSYGKDVHPSDSPRSCGTDMQSSQARSLQLQFLSTLSPPLFTGARIEGAGKINIKIGLVDLTTGKIVSSGPESSAKVEIVVLEGDFGCDGSNSWTSEDFENNILREREGKKPLLTGDIVCNLKSGIALVDDISFSDNSSWTRSRRFRLGTRVIDKFDGVEIKESITEAFIVRDHRGESYKKHHPPYLGDEVWRLEKIGKEGAFHKRLAQENIKSVKDFLIQLFIDPQNLRDILGPGMSSKMWEVTEEHARTCVLDTTVYVYFPRSSNSKTGVVFNILGQLMGLLADGHYNPMDKLSEAEKADAEAWLVSASQHWEDVSSFDSETSMLADISRRSSSLCSGSSPKTDCPSPPRFLANNRFGSNYGDPTASSPGITSSIFSLDGIGSFVDSPLNYDQLHFPSQASGSILNYDTVSLNQDFTNEDHLSYFESDFDLLPVESISAMRQYKADATGKAQRRWRKLFNVLKWIFKMFTEETGS